MKKFLPALALLCIFASPAFAWNCSDPLAARVPVPAGTTGSFGDGDGQLFLGTGTEGVKGQLYECKVPNPNPPQKSKGAPINETQNQSQNQSQNTSVNSTQNTSNQNVSSSGSTSKSTSSAKSQSNNANSNSNVNTLTPSTTSTSTGGTSNSNLTNANSATGGQGGTATAANNSSGNTSTYESNTTVDAAKIPVATALAVAPPATSPCVVGFGGGVQTMAVGGSFSAGKIDKNCAILETARSFASMNARLAYCKTMVSNKLVQKAGVTLEDCLSAPLPQSVPVPAPAPAPPPQPISVVIQQPQPIKVDTPVQAAIQSSAMFRDLGTFKVTRSYSTSVCPTVQTILGPRGVEILNRAVALSDNGEVILIGNVYTTAVATNYLRKHGVNRVVIRASDEQNSSVGVQIWSEQ